VTEAQQHQVLESVLPLHSTPHPNGMKRSYTDVLCLSHLRWDQAFQRPQQLMKRFTKGCRVFYVEEPVYEAGGPPGMRLQRTGEGVWRVMPILPAGVKAAERVRMLRELVDDLVAEWAMERFLLWYYAPTAVELTAHLRPVGVVYDCTSETHGWLGERSNVAKNERRLLRSADVVFTAGRSVHEAKRAMHPNTHLFPSSVDAAHFAAARAGNEEPMDQRRISRPRIGYAGIVDRRLNLELVAEMAALQPTWQFVFVGPVERDPATLPVAPNIHYLGPKTYAAMPSYLAGWDVAMMPLTRNEVTRYMSPGETAEYLAAGRPVVSTSVPDIVSTYGNRDLVRLADTPHEFIVAIAASLTEERGPKQCEADVFLSGMSWDRTWREMTQCIEQTLSERASLGLPPLEAANS
jgi:UDP-galactopyranose mutase